VGARTRLTSADLLLRRPTWPADPPMALQLIYQMFSKLLGWMVLRGSSDMTKEIEILVLRHQPAVLRRRPPRPRMNGTDRALIAALTRLLPVRRRLGPLISPDGVFRIARRVRAPTGDLHRGPRHPARAQDRSARVRRLHGRCCGRTGAVR
jgi:putative transposase